MLFAFLIQTLASNAGDFGAMVKAVEVSENNEGAFSKTLSFMACSSLSLEQVVLCKCKAALGCSVSFCISNIAVDRYRSE